MYHNLNKFEEIYVISNLLQMDNKLGDIDLNIQSNWEKLILNEKMGSISNYLFFLDEKNILNYEEIGEDGFKPILICSINEETKLYFTSLIDSLIEEKKQLEDKINQLELRIKNILTFDPLSLSREIKSTEDKIIETRALLKSNNHLNSLIEPLNEIDKHFQSIQIVANKYEDVYKNIILPIKEEGKNGIKQTVKWAIISIIVSSIISLILSFFFNK